MVKDMLNLFDWIHSAEIFTKALKFYLIKQNKVIKLFIFIFITHEFHRLL